MKNNKSLGQHWLKDRFVLDEIAALAAEKDLDSDEPLAKTCLEIGPGLGTLTSALLRRFEKVVSVEFDGELARKLPNSFPGKNLVVKNEDFLKFDLDSFESPYVIAGNIPYYITSPIITKILNTKNPPLRAVLLIQKEVAERIAAKKGDHTLLSLLVQNRANVEIGPLVKRDMFTPPPKVDSEVIVLNPKKPEVEDSVFDLIKIGFSSPRKKLSANLSSGLKLSRSEIIKYLNDLGIDQNVRPADLSIAEWKKLADFAHKG